MTKRAPARVSEWGDIYFTPPLTDEFVSWLHEGTPHVDKIPV